MTIRTFDTIVIGTGPGGEGAAMKLAKAGQQVAVVEAHTAGAPSVGRRTTPEIRSLMPARRPR